MSSNTNSELNKVEQTGKTIAHANARRITAEEVTVVSGGVGVILPSQQTSSACYPAYGRDWGGRDE